MNDLQQYVFRKSSYLPSDKLLILQQELEDLDEGALNALMMVEMRQPLVALILAIFSVNLEWIGFMLEIRDWGLQN